MPRAVADCRSTRSVAGNASGWPSARIATYSAVHGPTPGMASNWARASATGVAGPRSSVRSRGVPRPRGSRSPGRPGRAAPRPLARRAHRDRGIVRSGRRCDPASCGPRRPTPVGRRGVRYQRLGRVQRPARRMPGSGGDERRKVGVAREVGVDRDRVGVEVERAPHPGGEGGNVGESGQPGRQGARRGGPCRGAARRRRLRRKPDPSAKPGVVALSSPGMAWSARKRNTPIPSKGARAGRRSVRAPRRPAGEHRGARGRATRSASRGRSRRWSR